MALPHRPSFLVVDHNPDSRLLLTKTMLRKFPSAALVESDTIDAAVAEVARTNFDAIISHRVIGYDGATTVRLLRRMNPTVPIVMISGVDRRREAQEAGANTFVHFDAWLTVATVVEGLLPKPEPVGDSATSSDDRAPK